MKRMNRLARGIALCMLTVLAACGGGQEEAIPLDESKWELMELTVPGGFVFTPDDPAKYTIHFRTGNRLTGLSDCNNLSGSWQQEGQSLTVGDLGAIWAMCVPGSLHNNFVLYLRQVSGYAMEDDNMVLTTPREGVRLVFRPAP